MTRYRMFGVSLDALTMDQTVERCAALIEQRRQVQHVVLNASKSVMLQDVEGLADIINECELVNADGQSIVWAGRFLGIPVPERVAGIDLMERLLERATLEGWPVYFLGARSEVLARFRDVALERFPGLRIAGSRDGYFDDDESVARAIATTGARLVFVAITSPRKEFFLAQNLCYMGPVFAMGVGGSFDVWAGVTKRAPTWMQRTGFEWFFRFVQEPRRMWRRYLVGNARFVRMVLTEKLKR